MSSVNKAPVDAGICRIVQALKDKPGALLPILHAVQEEFGYISPEAVAIVAREMNLTRAEVHGVVTFYHDFRSEAPGRHILKICQAESCQAVGSKGLTAHAEKRLGVKLHHTTSDRDFTLEPVYCLGNCACSPSMMVDGEVFGRVTPERFEEIVEEVRKA
jgi:formate dehydrogenase subunit gamma